MISNVVTLLSKFWKLLFSVSTQVTSFLTEDLKVFNEKYKISPHDCESVMKQLY